MENTFEDTGVDSKFRFILLAARRAEQVMRGARPKMQYKSSKVARGAMDEIAAHLIEWDYGPAPEPEPPAIEAESGAEGTDVATDASAT